MANLVNILGPKFAVLGGGVMEALADEMMSVLVKTAKDHAMQGTSRRTALATQAGTLKDAEIIASKLGDNAGITGAAVLAPRAAK